jgi:hypothetical protein
MNSERDDRKPLTLMAAFRAWSDPDTLARVDELARYAFVPMIAPADHRKPDPAAELYDEWRSGLARLRQEFEARLASGELVATGFVKPIDIESRRRTIPVALYEIADLDYEAAEARCGDLVFISVEVFRPAASTSDLTADQAGDELGQEPGRRVFKHNPSYARVTIDRHVFFLTGGQCTIVRRLHEASFTDDPWIANKALLNGAGYSSDTLSGVFRRHQNPPWLELIEQRRGYSRLKL